MPQSTHSTKETAARRSTRSSRRSASRHVTDCLCWTTTCIACPSRPLYFRTPRRPGWGTLIAATSEAACTTPSPGSGAEAHASEFVVVEGDAPGVALFGGKSMGGKFTTTCRPSWSISIPRMVRRSLDIVPGDVDEHGGSAAGWDLVPGAAVDERFPVGHLGVVAQHHCQSHVDHPNRPAGRAGPRVRFPLRDQGRLHQPRHESAASARPGVYGTVRSVRPESKWRPPSAGQCKLRVESSHTGDVDNLPGEASVHAMAHRRRETWLHLHNLKPDVWAPPKE